MTMSEYPESEKLRAGMKVIEFLEWLSVEGWQINKPALVEYMVDCWKCSGTGYVLEQTREVCTACHGTREVKAIRETRLPFGDGAYTFLGIDTDKLEEERRDMIRRLSVRGGD